MNTTNVQATCESVNFKALLERAGYRVVGGRAQCPSCEGSSRLTVAVGDGVAYCHRAGCHRYETLRSLSHKLGLPVPKETAAHREARQCVERFADWISTCERVLIDHLWRLRARARWAHVARGYYPELEEAWDALADLYHAESEIMGALDCLAGKTMSRWVERQPTPIKLFQAFEEAQRCVKLIDGV